MPIRFRCVYCDKLLGIAKRKAGAVVKCPQCQQPLIVPTPEPEPTAAGSQSVAPPSNPGKLFEQDDFDVLLEPDATFRGPEPSPDRPKPPRVPKAEALSPQPFAVERHLPRPSSSIPTPQPLPAPKPGGLVFSTGLLILVLVVVLFLIVAAFGGGFLVGRMLYQG
jgi:phage FluMu protein Com